ncbi:branched-chain amino acid ABC transporter permease [Albimonas pacifica]|uniref:Amino acid/amide ABC transporter membrane protein 2, HAAT family n=1 Tax=Albimonas pacifica TaxID=1114924 RepID=A0A1I3FDL8_9RHOB|nr:branched-chain amino acid ABC transporter permease [Albimonas pacifica]SFI08991.1 amino acid/amide ABC transporter membrane protein 2, HAAT family [Albimonas pacifica]
MRALPLILAAGLALLALAPLAAPYLQFVLTVAVAKGFAALGVALLLRAGLISLGHAMFFAVGAYAAAFLAQAVGINDFLLLLPFAVAVSALAGLLVGAFLVRYRAIFFAMLNLAVSMVAYALASKLYSITGGTDGLRIDVPTLMGMSLEKAQFDQALYYISLVLLAVVGWLVHRYLKSPLGQALAAVHTNEVRLEYLGVSAWSTLLAAYTISAALAGIGGAIAAVAIGHVLPEYAFWTESGHLVLTAVLGGIAGIAGPFVGSIFLELIHTVAVGYAAEAWNLIVGVALLAVIFFLPRGLFGLIESAAGVKDHRGETEL